MTATATTATKNEYILFQNLTNLDPFRFVRRDLSSPVKKNTQIFLVVVGMVSRLAHCAERRRPRRLLQVNTIDVMNIHEYS